MAFTQYKLRQHAVASMRDVEGASGVAISPPDGDTAFQPVFCSPLAVYPIDLTQPSGSQLTNPGTYVMILWGK